MASSEKKNGIAGQWVSATDSHRQHCNLTYTFLIRPSTVHRGVWCAVTWQSHGKRDGKRDGKPQRNASGLPVSGGRSAMHLALVQWSHGDSNPESHHAMVV